MDNRRTTIVINKKFQYQHSLLVVALAVILVNAFLILRMLAPGDNPLVLSAATGFAIGAVELLLVGGIWYGCLKASHRIAGPVYVFNREICRLGEGDLTANIQLRDIDMFQEEAAAMNRSMLALRDRIAQAQSLAGELKTAQAGGGDTGAVVEQLCTALDGFTTHDKD